jgi:parallel beta-helix repeat protein
MMPAGAAAISPEEFPPAKGPYTGDYVYITEPGRYTLEHSLSHQYPVGVIIAASSVILDGQGYTIRPQDIPAAPTVGIWISLTDGSGNPVTGVIIRNVSIEGEGYGIYAEGVNTTDVPWGANRNEDPEAITAIASSRSVTLTDLKVTSCEEGILLHNQSDVLVSSVQSSGNKGSAIILRSCQGRITGSHFSGNGMYGIQIDGSSGTGISGCTITGNTGAGIMLDQADGITIYNNVFDNSPNIRTGPDCRDIFLATDRQEKENIIGGRILGGNYWEEEGVFLPARSGITDDDGDGIGDSPYDPAIGITDSSPLFKHKESIPVATETVEPAITLVPTPGIPLPTPIPTPLSIISGLHAAITGDTIPSVMEKGKTYPVVLHLINDGSDDWLAQHQIGVRALEGAASYGPAWMAVPISGTLQSGKIFNLEFSIRAPVIPGTHSLRYQVARVGSGVEILFGRAYVKTVTVV